jgi:glutamate formiminotransferase
VSRRIVECVPNFSEGRDRRKVETIAEAIAAVPGVLLLGLEMDGDHNRSVITFAGAPAAVAAAAVRGIAKAVELIDIGTHSGVHPRIGAADVVPFVPVEGITLAECAAIARETAEEVWRTLGVPVYLYEAAARDPERVKLENIRRGGLDFLRGNIAARPPDVGGPALHPTAGATIMGARGFLIAFNINLATSDLSIAKAIARKIRASSGGLPSVKAIGLPLASRGLTQVSMNLTNFEVTGLQRVYEAVSTEAARAGVEIAGSELIGFMPKRAVENAAADFLRLENFTPDRILENRLAQFEHPLPATGREAAAMAAAMASALAVKSAEISNVDHRRFEEHRLYFVEAARDHAALPMGRARELLDDITQLMSDADASTHADLRVARALCEAALKGADR